MIRTIIRRQIIKILSSIQNNESSIDAILMYHSVGYDAPQSIAEKSFQRQMAYVSDNFTVLTLNDLNKSWDHTQSPRAVITFDDGYLDNYKIAKPILEKYGIRGTFFISTNYIARKFPTWSVKIPMMNKNQIKELSYCKHEIGAHGHSHDKFTNLSENKLTRNIVKSKEILNGITKKPIQSFAYPSGRYSERAISLLVQEGFSTAVTVEENLLSMSPDWHKLPRLWIHDEMSFSLFKAKLSEGMRTFANFRNTLKRLAPY